MIVYLPADRLLSYQCGGKTYFDNCIVTESNVLRFVDLHLGITGTCILNTIYWLVWLWNTPFQKLSSVSGSEIEVSRVEMYFHLMTGTNGLRDATYFVTKNGGWVSPNILIRQFSILTVQLQLPQPAPRARMLLGIPATGTRLSTDSVLSWAVVINWRLILVFI